MIQLLLLLAPFTAELCRMSFVNLPRFYSCGFETFQSKLNKSVICKCKFQSKKTAKLTMQATPKTSSSCVVLSPCLLRSNRITLLGLMNCRLCELTNRSVTFSLYSKHVLAIFGDFRLAFTGCYSFDRYVSR